MLNSGFNSPNSFSFITFLATEPLTSKDRLEIKLLQYKMSDDSHEDERGMWMSTWILIAGQRMVLLLSPMTHRVSLAKR